MVSVAEYLQAARALEWTGDATGAKQAYARAVEQAQEPAEAVDALVGLARSEITRDEFDDASTHLQEAFERARVAGYGAGTADAHLQLARLRRFAGKRVEAIEGLTEAIREHRPTATRKWVADAHN